MRLEEMMFINMLLNGSEKNYNYRTPYEDAVIYVKRSMIILIIAVTLGYMLGGAMYDAGSFTAEGWSKITVQLIYILLLGYGGLSFYAGMHAMFSGRELNKIILIIAIVTGLWVFVVGISFIIGGFIALPKLAYKISKLRR